MKTPRIAIITLVALAGGFLWKGRALFRLWRAHRPGWTRGTVIAVLVTTALPLLVGIYLPFAGSPRPHAPT